MEVPKMAVRGVYTKAQQEMLDESNKIADTLVGWAKSPIKMVATEESIIRWAIGVDYWNPLWRDQNYAENTRWGSIIAFPGYLERFGTGDFHSAWKPEAGSFGSGTRYIGDDFEFFQPVRPGDTFRAWRRRPFMEDITNLDGEGPLTFKILINDVDYINQKDELVCTFKRYMQETIISGERERNESLPETKFKYTEEHLEFINKIANDEKIQGEEINYWEDVNIGDQPQAVIHGPTTVWDQIAFAMGRGDIFIPLREVAKKQMGGVGGPLYDAELGVIHNGEEQHYSDYVAQTNGNAQSYLFGPLSRSVMTRFVTNWMGDDGEIRKLNYRHMSLTPVGDTRICRGEVFNKRIENGEYLVDLKIWLQDLRGQITEAATVSVSLLSKNSSRQWR